MELEVGCIVKVRADRAFPSDLILITSSLPRGICYVETKNLDGETNLKQKIASQHVYNAFKGSDEELLGALSGCQVECELPNEFLYTFEGNFEMKNGRKFPIHPDQILLKGSSLRNTDWILGISVYTGHDTKIMKNSATSVVKRSKNQLLLNYFVMMTMGIQLTFAVLGSAILSIWTEY